MCNMYHKTDLTPHRCLDISYNYQIIRLLDHTRFLKSMLSLWWLDIHMYMIESWTHCMYVTYTMSFINTLDILNCVRYLLFYIMTLSSKCNVSAGRPKICTPVLRFVVLCWGLIPFRIFHWHWSSQMPQCKCMDIGLWINLIYKEVIISAQSTTKPCAHFKEVFSILDTYWATQFIFSIQT